MSDKFKGKYRNESARLRNWDYRSDASYFITICTNNREHYFGEINNGKMQFTPAGAIAHVLWYEIKNHAKNFQFGEFVVMPNHVHGILILDGNNDGNVGIHGDDDIHDDVDDEVGGDVGGRDVGGRDVACNVPTNTDPDTDTDPNTDPDTNPTNENELSIPKNEQMAAISPKSNSVSTIIRSYKSAVTKYCNRLELPFEWQSRFHDHIIRNDESFVRISEYIKHNPTNWKEDKFY